MSIHPHIQHRGGGHYGKTGAKISYPTRTAAQTTADRRGLWMRPYRCGDHWHLQTAGIPTGPKSGGVHGGRHHLHDTLELGERVSCQLHEENCTPPGRLWGGSKRVTAIAKRARAADKRRQRMAA